MLVFYFTNKFFIDYIDNEYLYCIVKCRMLIGNFYFFNYEKYFDDT